jgi:TRAP-type mannitol/chloroaromatic compound transport system permease large subunit
MGIVAAWPRHAVRGPVEAPTGFVAGVPPPLSRREAALAMLTVATEALLLGGVAVGYVHAVEAAATGCALLLIGGWVTGRLPRAALADVLVRTAGVAGGLFALFVGATTFTLLLRALGTDRWLVHAFAAMDPGHTLALALGVLVACALVLDAFELIFVVVPLLLPPVLLQVGDAAWVGVLVLLALQLGFIVPPLGYAVMMSSAAETSPPRLRALASALWPTQAVILAVLALLVALPRLVHLADPSSSAPAASAAPDADEAEIERRMREMSAPRAP